MLYHIGFKGGSAHFPDRMETMKDVMEQDRCTDLLVYNAWYSLPYDLNQDDELKVYVTFG